MSRHPFLLHVESFARLSTLQFLVEIKEGKALSTHGFQFVVMNGN
jgi:hypothetical protein